MAEGIALMRGDGRLFDSTERGESMQRVLRAVACAAILSLADCGKAPSGSVSNGGSGGSSDTELSTATAQDLLLKYQTANCRTSEVESDAGMFEPYMASLVASGVLRRGASAPDQGHNSVLDTSYYFEDNGFELVARFGVQNLYNDPSRDWNQLVVCYYVPASITVLDRTASDATGKVMTVVFTETDRPSKFTTIAADLPENGIARLSGTAMATTGQHTALFRRLDATGWQVDAVR